MAVSEEETMTGTGPSPEAEQIVIRVENVSVRYRVPHEQINTLKEYAIRSLQRRVTYNEFHALNNVSLDVRASEVFGIIGRNGAGKSTLLRVIARVMRPTSGRVWLRGRVAPLLELGAGFHQELTGRENIFLNGALLGHTRAEMREKFDEIVEFAELAEFIDTPIRNYSSGMSARLGFAVATAIQPEILIVDEVLSVGDERFQEKCEARMAEFRASGATILLVSHDADLVRSLCNRAVWLDKGRVRALGPSADVVDAYRKK